MSVDISWVLIVAVFWIGLLSVLIGLVWFAGAVLAERDRRAMARRPLAPLVELDLRRDARRRAAPHRYARTHHSHGDHA